MHQIFERFLLIWSKSLLLVFFRDFSKSFLGIWEHTLCISFFPKDRSFPQSLLRDFKFSEAPFWNLFCILWWEYSPSNLEPSKSHKVRESCRKPLSKVSQNRPTSNKFLVDRFGRKKILNQIIWHSTTFWAIDPFFF